jgi:uncharacterized protein with von Willebrand factor type A (vWA) domain
VVAMTTRGFLIMVCVASSASMFGEPAILASAHID